MLLLLWVMLVGFGFPVAAPAAALHGFPMARALVIGKGTVAGILFLAFS